MKDNYKYVFQLYLSKPRLVSSLNKTYIIYQLYIGTV